MMAPFKLSEMEIRVECAIGVAIMHKDQDSEELFRNAQFAVKQAKTVGKPQVYEPREASAARRRFSIETELRRALDKDQLQLFYQPLIDLKSGEVAGFEALARWDHEDRGEISPSEFIPVAEESGLILTLGRWAMDRAAATLATWDRKIGEPLPVYVGVNLSAIQVARDDIAAVVQSALRSSGLSGDRLTLELTESSIVQDPARAQRVFEALKALDATVAMDDFGTGYSSLAYLQRLPIDVLKIDRSFVTGMMVDPDSVAIVRAVLVDQNGMAKGVAYVDRTSRREVEVYAKAVVLAASCLETAHIMLNSKSRHWPDGIANSSGQLGKNLCDHLYGAPGFERRRVGRDDESRIGPERHLMPLARPAGAARCARAGAGSRCAWRRDAA